MIRRLFWLLFIFSLVGILVSSLLLFAAPSDEVARWGAWTFLGLSRPALQSLHYCLGGLLVLSGLVSALTGATRMMASGRNEQDSGPVWLAAVVIFVCAVLAGALMLPPGGTLVRLSEALRTWHASSFGEPPLGGAANLSPTELAKRLSLDPAKALTNLASHHIKLSSPDATVAEIASQNGLAPAAVYETMRGGKEPVLEQTAGTSPSMPALPADPPPGLGRLKLSDVCEQYSVNLDKALETLKKAGIKASGDLTLREIAQRNLVLPIEVYDALRGAPQSAPQAAGPGQAPAAPPVPASQSGGEASAPQAIGQVNGQAAGQVAEPGQAPAQAAVIAPEGLEHTTLAAFCRDNSLDTAVALARLKAKGIVAFSDMTFRELAIENNLTAEQVMRLMMTQ